MKDEKSEFFFRIEAIPTEEGVQHVFGWANSGVPPEVVIAMTVAFLRIAREEYQDWFEGSLGEYSGDE